MTATKEKQEDPNSLLLATQPFDVPLQAYSTEKTPTMLLHPQKSSEREMTGFTLITAKSLTAPDSEPQLVFSEGNPNVFIMRSNDLESNVTASADMVCTPERKSSRDNAASSPEIRVVETGSVLTMGGRVLSYSAAPSLQNPRDNSIPLDSAESALPNYYCRSNSVYTVSQRLDNEHWTERTVPVTTSIWSNSELGQPQLGSSYARRSVKCRPDKEGSTFLNTTGLFPPTSGSGVQHSDTAYHPGRYTEIRAMLITAERELADLREEHAKRGIALETLNASLDRERAKTQDLRSFYIEAMESVRSEHEVQTKQLREQIRILKAITESAMADKSKVSEDAARRKQELLQILEKERDEKRHVMADYREQTESLIAEQGKEITVLRAALEKVKDEYDKLSSDHSVLIGARDAFAQQLEEAKTQIDRERVEAAKRVKDIQSNLMSEKGALQDELSAMQEVQLRESTKWKSKQQELSNQLQRVQERMARQEEENRHTLEGLKQVYRKDVESMQKEIESSKTLRERQAMEHRKELEEAVRNEEKTSESLRRALEEVRREKELAVIEGYKQREELQVQYRGKITQLQTTLDAVTTELAQERNARKDAEAEAEVLQIRTENIQKSLQDLSRELEAVQAEHRSKERNVEQAHEQVVEELQSKLRSSGTALAYAQQQLRQEALEQQRLRDNLIVTSATLERVKSELQEESARAEAELTQLSENYRVREEEWVKANDQLRSDIRALGEERMRLELALNEAEAKLQAMSKNTEAERVSLERTSLQLQETKVLVKDLRHMCTQEKQHIDNLEEAKRELCQKLQESKLYANELENAIQLNERKLYDSHQELQRMLKEHEEKLIELEQQHNAELSAARLAVEQARGEANRSREAVASNELALQKLREEMTQLSQNAALHESAFQEEMEEVKKEHEETMRRMDELLNILRADLAKSQAICTEYQRELSTIHRNSKDRYSDLEGLLEQSEASRVRLQDDAKYRDQLNQELQGTVRLLTSRLRAHEEEIKRLQEELAETARRLQDIHTLMGRKDATIGQLNAKLRAYESRGGLL